jgi:hypothetical protein
MMKVCAKVIPTFTASLVSMVSGVATEVPWWGRSILGLLLGRSTGPADAAAGGAAVALPACMACRPE